MNTSLIPLPKPVLMDIIENRVDIWILIGEWIKSDAELDKLRTDNWNSDDWMRYFGA